MAASSITTALGLVEKLYIQYKDMDIVKVERNLLRDRVNVLYGVLSSLNGAIQNKPEIESEAEGLFSAAMTNLTNVLEDVFEFSAHDEESVLGKITDFIGAKGNKKKVLRLANKLTSVVNDLDTCIDTDAYRHLLTIENSLSLVSEMLGDVQSEIGQILALVTQLNTRIETFTNQDEREGFIEEFLQHQAVLEQRTARIETRLTEQSRTQFEAMKESINEFWNEVKTEIESSPSNKIKVHFKAPLYGNASIQQDLFLVDSHITVPEGASQHDLDFAKQMREMDIGFAQEARESLDRREIDADFEVVENKESIKQGANTVKQSLLSFIGGVTFLVREAPATTATDQPAVLPAVGTAEGADSDSSSVPSSSSDNGVTPKATSTPGASASSHS